jgi:hypothetical protein
MFTAVNACEQYLMPDYQSDKKISFLFFIETAGIRACGLL